MNSTYWFRTCREDCMVSKSTWDGRTEGSWNSRLLFCVSLPQSPFFEITCLFQSWPRASALSCGPIAVKNDKRKRQGEGAVPEDYSDLVEYVYCDGCGAKVLFLILSPNVHPASKALEIWDNSDWSWYVFIFYFSVSVSRTSTKTGGSITANFANSTSVSNAP